MKKALIPATALLLFLTACNHDYVAMCQEMYDRINNLDCISEGDKFDIAEFCPESYNTSGYKYDDYFDCIEKNIACVDGENGKSYLSNTVANCIINNG